MKTWISCGFLLLCSSIALAQPATGIITGKLPQLSYSNGADRLGSAKAGYIDTGIVVKVVDSVMGNYTLQLSQHRTAYLAKEFLRFTTDSFSTQPATTESWHVRGGDVYDTVSISLSRTVPYTSWMENEPTAIYVELYGVQSNTNWITQLQTAKGIATVSWKQTDNDVVQACIRLKQAQHLGYRISYSGKRLQLIIKRKPAHPHLHDMVVAIDAGHGGSNTGASGIATKVLEKDYTILFAKELQQLLQKKGIQTIMIRDKDTTIDNKDRLLYLQPLQPDVLISFHLNSSSRTTVRGVSTYYKHPAFQPLTQHILSQLLEIDNLPEFGNIGSFNFQLVQPTDYPSCLVEVAFLSNEQDEQLIRSSRFQHSIAQKVYEGLLHWVKELK
ncbi:MAG: N-acetylmuramoyl-L-alanine amidase [Chitinophagaceae bacterium]|nr:N-acetylmuramoyl-L-alanine amidase [Chitinophagaceae bacterium]